MKTLSKSSTSNIEPVTVNQICDCCGAVEGKPHPTRGLDVELFPMKSQPLMACQICLLHYQEIPAAQPKKIHNAMHPKTFFTYLFFTVIFVLVFSAIIMAQPPGLPATPDQAPIMLGREVATLIDGERKAAGRYSVTFDALNLASGMYIYRLKAAGNIFTKELTLIK